MTWQFAISTIVGAAIFPFLIWMMWGKLVEKFGVAGGWMAAFFIVGTTWILNHGMANALIKQGEGGVWVDMGLAAGVGLLVASTVSGSKFGKAIPNVVAAIVGGALAGAVIFFSR
jgi:hypothetical protein